MDFITDLEKEFESLANKEQGEAMAKYMRNLFVFIGIAAPLRKSILKNLLQLHHAEIKQHFKTIAFQLYEKPQREFHYCAIEILIKYTQKNFEKEDINWIETMLSKNSWWDSVDTISSHLLGGYLFQYPEETPEVIEKFKSSNNLWLYRSTIIYQLSYKKNTNFKQIKELCEYFKNSNEFFIQKAIGWALREYAKTSPEDVINFVHNTQLKPLSKREALKNIEKK